MSSHREAPEIAKDPVADGTDTYAFVSPDKPGTVTLIANFIPLQAPDGGPNFYEFGEDINYDIQIANAGRANADIIYRFRFTTKVRNEETFLYNTGPITDIKDASWNRPQFYSVERIEGRTKRTLARGLPCPPVNVGRRSTPDYAHLADQAVHKVGSRTVFAGQRADAFHVDLGSIFDLGALRPFNHLHLISMPDAAGVNGLQGFNVHTIALQVPIREVSRHGNVPTNVEDPDSVIGVWATASRRKSQVFDETRSAYVGVGPHVQVSRLANPLFNEVLVPMGDKDRWNHLAPRTDSEFTKYVDHPELAALLPVLYPGVFPNLAAYTKPRADLNAILMTGIPSGVVPGFANFTGTTQADLLRLNLAIPPATTPNDLGVIGGDLAGWPNGRRLEDDVVKIALRAVAGVTIPLVDPSYTPDAAAALLTDGTSNTNAALLDHFPYLGLPGGGYQTVPGTTGAS
jgi:hypothetical protein